MVDAKLGRLMRIITNRKLRIEYAGEPRRPRLQEIISETGAIRDLSPRLPVVQMYEWLDAFEKGIDMGLQIAKETINETVRSA
jgi:hypothetical protein